MCYVHTIKVQCIEVPTCIIHAACENATTQKLLYNGSKSFSLCFKKNTLKVSAPSFYLDQMKIPTVKQCRYLGITIYTQNSYIDLKKQMRKLYANVNLLLRKFAKCSVGVKCFLFKRIVLTFIVHLCGLIAQKQH